MTPALAATRLGCRAKMRPVLALHAYTRFGIPQGGAPGFTQHADVGGGQRGVLRGDGWLWSGSCSRPRGDDAVGLGAGCTGAGRGQCDCGTLSGDGFCLILRWPPGSSPSVLWGRPEYSTKHNCVPLCCMSVHRARYVSRLSVYSADASLSRCNLCRAVHCHLWRSMYFVLCMPFE